MPLLCFRRLIALMHNVRNFWAVFGYLAIVTPIFYYISRHYAAASQIHRLARSTQWVGNSNFPRSHERYTMGKDTSGIPVIVSYVDSPFTVTYKGDDNVYHGMKKDIYIQADDHFKYRWVQVVAKKTTKPFDGVSIDSVFYDGGAKDGTGRWIEYPYYYTDSEDKKHDQPGYPWFTDQPRTFYPNVLWQAQTTLFAFDTAANQRAGIWVGTYQWGFCVNGGKKTKVLKFVSLSDSSFWPETRYIVDSLTDPH